MTNKDIGVPVAPVQNATGLLDQRPPSFKGSIFLVSVETGPKKDGHETFLCTRLDKHPSHIEIIAVPVDTKKLTKAQDPSSLVDKSLLTEMYFPWNRVVSVKNLGYKAK